MKKHRLLKAAAAGSALYAGVCGLVFYEVFNRNATIPNKIYESQRPKPAPDAAPQPEDERLAWMKEQQFTEVTLTNADGHTLKAFYLPADTDSDRYAVCAHGYRCHGRREFRYITKFYHDRGFHVLLVDHRASGDSEGAWITFGKKESEDLLLWINWIKKAKNASPRIVLHGVSMGAATVLMLSDRPELLPYVKYIVSDCSYTTAPNQYSSVLEKANIPSRLVISGVNVFNRVFSGFSLYEAAPIEHVSDALVPILFVHGGADDFVPTTMVYKNYDACPTDKDLLIVDGAGHAESYQTNPAAYDEKMEAFMHKYLDAVPAETA